MCLCAANLHRQSRQVARTPALVACHEEHIGRTRFRPCTTLPNKAIRHPGRSDTLDVPKNLAPCDWVSGPR